MPADLIQVPISVSVDDPFIEGSGKNLNKLIHLALVIRYPLGIRAISLTT